MSDNQIAEAARLISKLFVGKDFNEIKNLDSVVTEEFSGYREIFESVMSAIEEYVKTNNGNVVLEGQGKILNHPEYNDSEKVKNFLSVVTSKERLVDLLANDSENIEINIKIGGEEGKEMPQDCSLVTATYSASGVKIGTYGVIGPLRMDYQKVISVLEGVGKILEDILSKQ